MGRKPARRPTTWAAASLHEISSRDSYESAFKEAIKAGSTAIAVVRHRQSPTPINQKRMIELAAKYHFAGNLLSGRFC